MNIEDFYESQAAIKELGGDIDGRVKKAARMFSKHLGAAHWLLDIGCGVGSVALYLKDTLRAEEVYGVEVSEKRVELAKGRGVKAVQQDLNAGALPFEDGYFDAIFCGEIIEYLLDPDHLLDEVHRVLTRNGVCILTTPNLAVWYNRIALLFGFQPWSLGTSLRHDVGRLGFTTGAGIEHIKVFTERAFKELLEFHNFSIQEVASLAAAQLKGKSLLSRLINMLDGTFSLIPSLGGNIILGISRRGERSKK